MRKLYNHNQIKRGKMNTRKLKPIKVDVSKIWQYMQENQISQTKLAKLAGISPTTLSLLLNKKETKKMVTLFKISLAIKANLQDMLI